MVFVALAFMMFAPEMWSQGRMRLNGHIYDALTSRELRDVKVRMLDSSGKTLDSTKVTVQYYVERMEGDREIFGERASYFLNVPKVEGNYVIEAVSEGYETTHFPYAFITVR